MKDVMQMLKGDGDNLKVSCNPFGTMIKKVLRVMLLSALKLVC